MRRIVTITLNPAFDVHCAIESFVPFSENYASDKSRFIGGKGINVSMALNSLGTESEAVCVIGKENGEDFLNQAKQEGLNITPVFTAGCIRENLTIHEKSTKETRISFEGFKCNEEILNNILKTINADSNTIVAFCGRLPRGISKQKAISFLKTIKEKGAFLVVDCNSFTLEELCEIKPSLIKPNETEAQQFLKSDDFVTTAKELNKQGIEHVIISLGGDGGIYASNCLTAKISVPKIDVLSTIGAGDSTIAGFLYGIYNDLKLEEIIKTAFATGSAACLTEGTTPPEMAQILKILNDIKLYIL